MASGRSMSKEMPEPLKTRPRLGRDGRTIGAPRKREWARQVVQGGSCSIHRIKSPAQDGHLAVQQPDRRGSNPHSRNRAVRGHPVRPHVGHKGGIEVFGRVKNMAIDPVDGIQRAFFREEVDRFLHQSIEATDHPSRRCDPRDDG